MSSLTVERLKKSYGEHLIIDGVSFALEKGDLIALLGPSGSGKTTVLRSIAGLETVDADSGEIKLEGERLSGGGGALVPPEKRRMGMVFQNYAVWPHMTVFENVAFPLRIAREPDAAVQKRVVETLSLVKLDALRARFPHELSGGQQQRVALARALVAAPRLLLLDEPLSNLDALLRDELGTEIRRLQQTLGLTAILVTHDQREALALADRILVLEKGRIAADGRPEALFRDPPTDFVAEFLAGGQRLKLAGEPERVVLPRRWRVVSAGATVEVEIVARIFRGTEYEYQGRAAGLAEPVRFFDAALRESGSRVGLCYTP